MTIIALPAFQDNYIWVITDEAHQTFACVDPGDAEPVLTFAYTTGLV
ncbi:MAG TPA: hydroxyacylglutathione hydrolase, partial [Legionella sp.]|nr:hydroxyacylglutathione hydrolase [Legionella sp.]